MTDTPRLFHRRQLVPYGCMYHSAYALTGDEALLEHACDVSRTRFHANLAQHGYFLRAFHMDWCYYGQMYPAWWEAARALRHEALGGLGLLLTIDSERLPGYTHMVAARVHRSGLVMVSDSGKPSAFGLDFDEFLNSPYARAYEVDGLFRADPALYPEEDARKHAAVVKAMASEQGVN